MQTAVHYTLMLAVMYVEGDALDCIELRAEIILLSNRTFNVYFFLSIILGVGIGEILFGRFCVGTGH